MVAGYSIAAMSRIARAQRRQTRAARPKVRLKRTLHERRRARPGSSGPRNGGVAGVAGLRRGSAATDGEWAAVAGWLGGAEADAPALREHGGNKTKTAETLGITREGLHKKLAKYGMG